MSQLSKEMRKQNERRKLEAYRRALRKLPPEELAVVIADVGLDGPGIEERWAADAIALRESMAGLSEFDASTVCSYAKKALVRIGLRENTRFPDSLAERVAAEIAEAYRAGMAVEEVSKRELMIEKHVITRFVSLLKDDVLLGLLREFGTEPFRRSCVLQGLDGFLAKIRAFGKVALEIGPWHGLSSVILSRYFEKVISLDVYPSEYRARILFHAGVDNVEVLEVRDSQIEETIAGLTFDFAFLDGDHAHRTERDWNATKHCGRILFHEYWPSQRPVYDLVNSLPAGEVTKGETFFAYWEEKEH